MTWKFKQIKPQKARGKFDESLWTDSAWSAENKEDGDRRIAQFYGTAIRFTGTRESVDGTGFVEKTANLPHLQTRGRHLVASGTVLDGEIVAPHAKHLPGGESKYVTAIMGSLPERAIEMQERFGWLEYRVFDCLFDGGRDIRGERLHYRQGALETILEAWGNPHARLIDSTVNTTEKRRMWDQAKEGLVFKHANHTYGNEKLWVKLKKEATADVVVMGFKKGKGKYAGSVGAIIFGQYRAISLKNHLNTVGVTEMGACRGFTDDQMQQFADRPARYVGKVFRIKHNGREPTGAFRHPRFDGWRPDKSPEDCVYDANET